MTAPPKKKTLVNCEKKRRFSDEFSARAGVMGHLSNRADVPALWIYKCGFCLGWHMSSKPTSRKNKVTKDEAFLEPMEAT